MLMIFGLDRNDDYHSLTGFVDPREPLQQEKFYPADNDIPIKKGPPMCWEGLGALI